MTPDTDSTSVDLRKLLGEPEIEYRLPPSDYLLKFVDRDDYGIRIKLTEEEAGTIQKWIRNNTGEWIDCRRLGA